MDLSCQEVCRRVNAKGLYMFVYSIALIEPFRSHLSILSLTHRITEISSQSQPYHDPI